MPGLLEGTCVMSVCILACLIITDQWQTTHAHTKDASLRQYLMHFSAPRNELASSVAMTKTRKYLVDQFEEIGLHTWTERFSAEGNYGYNVVGRVTGRLSGTSDDKLLIIGAHFDTVKPSPGVDDNGSGVAALLHAAKQFLDPDMKDCQRNYTLMLVAFDRKECYASSCTHTDPRQCVCSFGSKEFIRNLTNVLSRTRGTIEGAVILDSVLNYDNSAHAQNITEGMRQLFSPDVEAIARNDYRGDFLVVLGRKPSDQYLINNFTRNFETAKFKVRPLPLVLQQAPSSLDNRYFHQNVGQFYYGDHYHFWNHDPPMNAIYITDTKNLRGYMKHCHHNSCDNMNHVQNERLEFLMNTIGTLVLMMREMTQQVGCTNRTIAYKRSYLTSNTGELTSPGFPQRYPNNADYIWIITVSEGHRVQLEFTEFLLEGNDCISDYVEVRDGADGSAQVLGRFCGGTIPNLKPLTSKHQMFVTFRSDDLDSYKGFKAKWSAHVITSSGPSLSNNFISTLTAIMLLTVLTCRQ